MPAVRAAATALALLVAASAAQAVGLGPLTASGTTNSDRKGFYLTLINPYPATVQFRLYGIEWDSEQPAQRVRIPVNRPLLGPKSQRRILVIAFALKPGEHHSFRVCAERADSAAEGMINARVCSKLIARRRG